jgi:RNA polymerase-binding protein DksA
MHKEATPMTRKPSVKRKQFLARTYEHLRDTKTRLSQQADSELRAERDGERGDGLDSYDRASEECDRDISSRLSQRERIKISQIDGALERIAEMKYGVCENCGFKISETRLKVMPFSRLCRDCQHDQERAARIGRPYEDGQHQFGELGSIHADEANGNGSKEGLK